MVRLKGQQETGDTQLAAVPKDTVVLLSQEFHADLERSKWALREPYLVDWVSLYSPFFDHTKWDPELHWLSDATLKCGWRFLRRDRSVVAIQLNHCRKSRSVVRAKCAKHSAISIIVLELLAMVITAYVMVVQKSNHSNVEGARVVMLDDHVSAVTWVNKYGGTRDPRAAFLMRYLGRIEICAGWCFELRIFQGLYMCWLMAFRGGLVKRLVRDHLPFTRVLIGRRNV